MDLVVRFK